MLQITLEAARVNAGYSQKKAAELLDVSRDTLRNYEKGKTYPNSKTLKRVFELYGVTADDLRF